jgi:hypothetical protein
MRVGGRRGGEEVCLARGRGQLSAGTIEGPMWTAAPWAVRLWFGWAFALLAGTGLFLPQIIAFVDFSERAPFSLLGIFMMAELAAVLFGITVVMQRKRIGLRFAIGIAALAVPMLAGLPPALFQMPPAAANGWYALMVPLGLLVSIVLIVALLRPSARAWFVED